MLREAGCGAVSRALAADNRQPGIPEFGSVLASGLLWRGVDGQRCLLQLKPDPLGGIEIPARDRLPSIQSRRSDTIREVGRLLLRTKNVDLHQFSAVRSESKVTFGHRSPVLPVAPYDSPLISEPLRERLVTTVG